VDIKADTPTITVNIVLITVRVEDSMMTQSTTPSAAAGSTTGDPLSRPWEATILSASIGKLLGMDEEESITYDAGHFAWRMGPTGAQVQHRELDVADLGPLRDGLEKQMIEPTTEQQHNALRCFIDLISQTLDKSS